MFTDPVRLERLMLAGRRGARRSAVAAAVVGLVGLVGLTACSGDEPEAPQGEDAFEAVGGPDSACPLPVVFDRAEGWAPERLEPLTPEERASADPDAVELLEQLSSPGPFEAACELESPVNIGFLRVFTGPLRLADRDPEALLQTFVDAYDDDAGDVRFAEVSSEKGLALVEMTYESHDELEDADVPRRAFLVAGADGVVLVHLGGIDAEEHEGMLPAYELARSSVRLAG